ncbi:MAG: ribonuclease Z [Bradymonadales bacterium]|nr:ribonuclease Z [Bradymonadales bacterium]
MSGLKAVFLGTSSGKPTLSRGVAAVALVLDGELILFDCGEGTQLQMMRAGLRHSRLKQICLSHFHGDHVNGLPGLLGTMTLDQHPDPVGVLGPRGLKEYFALLRRLGILVPRFPVSLREMGRDLSSLQGEHWAISFERLEHRIETWGFRFQEADKPGRFDVEAATSLGVPMGPLFGCLQRGQPVVLQDGRTVFPHQVLGAPRPGRSVAYITDTRPCEASLRLADRVDLLIHEGTYADELRDQAGARGHSTVVEAAILARQAGARALVITHLSPKYTDIRPLLDSAREQFENTRIAKDLMELAIEAHG